MMMGSVKKAAKVNVFKLYQKEQNHQHMANNRKLLDFGIKDTVISNECKFFKDSQGFPDSIN